MQYSIHHTTRHNKPTLLPQMALPKLNSLHNSHAYRLKLGIPVPGLMYSNSTLKEPNATIRELLMGLHVVHSRFSGTRVSRARASMRTRYPDRIGNRTIIREVLNVRVRCMMRMGDVAK